MATTSTSPRGTVAALWRYPGQVDARRGARLGRGHRARTPGRPGLCPGRRRDRQGRQRQEPPQVDEPARFRAAGSSSRPRRPGRCPPARITTPDGATIDTDDPGFDERFSATRSAGRCGWPRRPAMPSRIEGYWPDYDWLESPRRGLRGQAAARHVLRCGRRPPPDDHDPRHAPRAPDRRADSSSRASGRTSSSRSPDGSEGFPENDWAGHTIRIGDEVRLAISAPCRAAS